MNFDLNDNKDVVVLLGAGDMGLAIIKRFSAGKKKYCLQISMKKNWKLSSMT